MYKFFRQSVSDWEIRHQEVKQFSYFSRGKMAPSNFKSVFFWRKESQVDESIPET